MKGLKVARITARHGLHTLQSRFLQWGPVDEEPEPGVSFLSSRHRLHTASSPYRRSPGRLPDHFVLTRRYIRRILRRWPFRSSILHPSPLPASFPVHREFLCAHIRWTI